MGINKLNYENEYKKIVEKSGKYKYYDYTEEIVEKIIVKNINDVENEEWRILLQMIYPKNMIGSGLFQPILIFKIGKEGKRIDPPVEAYDGITKELLSKIIKYIEKNSGLKINNTWKEFIKDHKA